MKLPKIIDKDLFTISDECGSLNLFKLAIPQFLEYVFVNMLGTINTIMLSGFSEDSVAAVGTAATLVGLFTTVQGMAARGAAIIISISLGRNDRKAADNSFGLALVLGLVISAFLGIIGFMFANPIISLMNITGMVYNYAIVYFKIRMIFIFMSGLSFCFTTVFRCHGYVKPILLIGLISNIANVLFCYIVIYGKHNDIFSDKITGIAFAAVLSQVIGLAVALIVWKCKKISADFHFNIKAIKRIFTFGIPSGISSMSYAISTTFSSAIIAVLGTEAINTKIYVCNINYYVYLFGYSVGLANSLMVGRVCGQGNYEKANKMQMQNLKVVMCLNALLSIIVLVFSKSLLGLFTKNANIIAIGQSLLTIDILVEIGRGSNHIGENGLIGVGDIVPTTIISIFSCWVINILGTYILGIVLGLGLKGCFFAFAADEFFRGTMYLFRWRTGKWRKKFVTQGKP